MPPQRRLLNYSTEVPADKTAAQIEVLLVQHGALNIMKRYNDGQLVGFIFNINTAHGPRAFKLPVDAGSAHKALVEDWKRSVQRPWVEPPASVGPEAARRVAWRIAKDWLEANLALIRLEQLSLERVMLPYMVVDSAGHTLYEVMESRGLALPPSGTEGQPRALDAT